MYNKKNKSWIYLSIGGICLSVLSLLLPIVTYQSGINNREVVSFNIFGLLNGGLAHYILHEFTGTVLFVVSNTTGDLITALVSFVGVGAILLSFWGIRSMSKQYESVWPFRLTIIGLIGTMIPSFILLILFFASKGYLRGTVSLGAYVFITPIAMITSCVAVVKRHYLTRQELSLQKEAASYIFPAGDLSRQ